MFCSIHVLTRCSRFFYLVTFDVQWLAMCLLLYRHHPLVATLPPRTTQQVPPSRRQAARQLPRDQPSGSVPQQCIGLAMNLHPRRSLPHLCALCWNVSTLSVLLPLLFVTLICLTSPRLMLLWLLAMLLSLPLLIYLKRYQLSRNGTQRQPPYRSPPVFLLLRFGPKVKLRTKLYGRTPS